MEQLETKQESTDLASQVERELSGIVDDASKVVLNVGGMFKSKGEEQEGEEQDGGNEKTENLDKDYLDSKFKSLYDDVSKNQEKDFLEVYNLDGKTYIISLDYASFDYNSEEHSCKLNFYNRRKSLHYRGPIFITDTVDITDKETFDNIESAIRGSIESKNFNELEKKLNGLIPDSFDDRDWRDEDRPEPIDDDHPGSYPDDDDGPGLNPGDDDGPGSNPGD